jgi:hypothetical protein
MRENIEISWRMANEYDKENGYETPEWQTGGQGDIVGDYMIKDGVVVWGVSTEQEAEEALPAQLAKNQGFDSIDDMKEELVNSWRMSHDYDVEAGTATGEWQTGGQTAIVGPYMIKDGEVVFGATTPEEAEAILAGEYLPTDEEVDFDSMEPELPEEVAVDENGMPIEMPDDDMGDDMEMKPAVMPDDGEMSEEDATVAELRAQIEALQRQIEDLSEQLDETLDDKYEAVEGTKEVPVEEDGNALDYDGSPLDPDLGDDEDVLDEMLDETEMKPAVMPDDDGMADDGMADEPAEDDFDNFDDMEPELPEEVAINDDGTMVDPPNDGAGDDMEFTPAVMPDDPMDWPDQTPSETEESQPEYVSAVMPDNQGADTGDDAPADGGFTDQHPGATPDPSTGEPAEEPIVFHDPTVDPMADPHSDPHSDPMSNPEEEQNL